MIFREAERFIDESIRSVVAQTLDSWELLLVDDGSTDRGATIAEGYAQRPGGQFRILRHPGGGWRGTGPSRNLGMQAARGRYLAFLDADDVYEPTRLERHVHVLEQDPTLGVVLSPDVYWYSWDAGRGRVAPHHDRIIGPAVVPGRRIPPPALIVGTLLNPGAAIPTTCSITFRASAIQEVGPIPEGFPGHYEDQVLICKLLLSQPALVLDECLARYRQRPESLTQGNAPLERIPGSPANEARGHFLDWLRGYISDRGLDLPELMTQLDSQITTLSAPPSHGPRRIRRSLRDLIGRLLPEGAAGAVLRIADNGRQRLLRGRVMRYIERFEQEHPVNGDRVGQSGVVSNQAIRAYWNERVDDTRLSVHPPGSAGFYAALDAYRLEKSDYLLRVVDFGAWAGRDVLEIGCGAGLDLVRFARGGARVTGVDLARTAIELAGGYCRVAGVDARLIESDGARLPLPDGSFDLVYCMAVLPFVCDPAALVAEAHRVLRPGGQAIFMVYNRRSWMNLLARFRGGLGGHSDAPAFRLYDAVELERLLAPFSARRLLTERLPSASDRHQGIAGAVFDCGLVPVLQALPEGWLRPFGWHLIALCRKQE